MGINGNKLTFVIADDHDIVRTGLVAMLNSQPNMAVLAEACDGLQAVEMADLHRPEILIIDNQMPGHDGIEVARQVRDRGLPMKIIMLTMHGHESYVRKAFQAGVDGYVLKDNVSTEIFEAIKTVEYGDKYLTPTLGSAVTISRLISQEETDEDDPLSELTDRERTVFHAVVRGRTNPEIAEALTISPRTIETHRMNMMAKLGIPTRDKLIVFAIAKNLVEIDGEGNIVGEQPKALA